MKDLVYTIIPKLRIYIYIYIYIHIYTYVYMHTHTHTCMVRCVYVYIRKKCSLSKFYEYPIIQAQRPRQWSPKVASAPKLRAGPSAELIPEAAVSSMRGA